MGSVGVRPKEGRQISPAGSKWAPKDWDMKGKSALSWENFPNFQQFSV